MINSYIIMVFVILICSCNENYWAMSRFYTRYKHQFTILGFSSMMSVVTIMLISIHTIQCRTRQTEAEQYIQEEYQYIKYSKILI